VGRVLLKSVLSVNDFLSHFPKGSREKVCVKGKSRRIPVLMKRKMNQKDTPMRSNEPLNFVVAQSRKRLQRSDSSPGEDLEDHFKNLYRQFLTCSGHFQTTVIEHYQRRTSPVDEAIIKQVFLPRLDAALHYVWPRAAHQRCWAHKLRNLENKLKASQGALSGCS
jgi:hypothetical protein